MAAFFVLEKGKMKTIVYIDGFNFYYGLLKASSYKWIDYYSLFLNEVFPVVDSGFRPTELTVKLFTAPTKANFHPKGEASAHAQSAFLRALKYANPENSFEIILGNHLPSPSSVYPYCPSSPKRPHSFEKIRVWKLEEKLTDVQLSLCIYRDVVKGNCDQVVLCSNDSDMSPVLSCLREDYPSLPIGVVFPIQENGDGRRVSKELSERCTWSVTSVLEQWLINAQLPDRVKTGKKPIDKPEIWK